MKRIACFTANIGNYDEVHNYSFQDSNIDYFYFTDGQHCPDGFDLIQVKERWFPEDTLNIKKARLIKANPFKYLPNAERYDVIIWVDACFVQTSSLMPLLPALKENSLLTMQHPNRNCIYKEADALIDLKIGDPVIIQKHYSKLKALDYPEGNGLAATGVMIRKNNEEARAVSNLWEICLSKDLQRDQLFFDYVCWVLKVKYSSFPYSDRNLFWHTHSHLGKRT